MDCVELSEFQKKKILHVFKLIYDTDMDGCISKTDFTVSKDKICRIMGWEKGSRKHEETENTLTMIWEELQQKADKNSDNKVTVEEWLSVWKASIGEGSMPEWQKKFMRFIFDVNDKSGDNEIDADEYKSYYRNYISEEECDQAFQAISGGKNITFSEFEKLWKEYFFSNDKKAKGNYLFGIPDFMK